MLLSSLNVYSFLILIGVAVTSALFARVFYNLYLHPLSKFPGPWYATSSSFTCAIISVLKIESPWLFGLVKHYGSLLSTSNLIPFFTSSRSNYLSIYTYPYYSESVVISSTIGIEGHLLGTKNEQQEQIL